MLEKPPPNPTATPGPRPALSAVEGLLNKREFLAGRQCHKQLWWRVHDPDAEELIPDSNTRALMEAVRQVGLSAREYAPGGRLIDFRYQARSSRVAATAAAMETKAPALYEGTFTGDGLVVRADILEAGGDGWTLVEVKSSVEVSGARCLPELPAHHLSTRHGARKKKIQEWEAQGWRTISQLPADVELTGLARRQASAVRGGRPPLAFLDFEAVQPPIPRWPGCGPYTHIPVQLSCHTLAAGRYNHVEWLADGPADPRPEFARRLLAACSGSGSIVVYNSGYEAGCIRPLCEAVPEPGPALTDVRDRLVDLLPVLAPEVRYRGMAISEGRTATNELMRLLFDDSLDPQERSVLREQLLAYCKLDTRAMVRLFERLSQLARGV